jgi:type II secretory pathway component GspD/PulD (secretin)
VTLDALAKKGKSRVLANPNLSALDGQPAIAFIGDQIKYVIAVQQTQQGQVIQTETATVGITLKVTGKASPDGTITLYVHPEVSAVTDYLNVGGGINLPQISTRFVDTTIRVKDGETIGIGGLIREQDVHNLQKVPILGDLPFFGKLLFTSKSDSKAKSNVVVLITAHLIKD